MYNTISANKTVSSLNLINYLEKENQTSFKFVEYLNKETQIEAEKSFFNESSFFSQGEVVKGIDKNCKGLSRDESRWFSLTFNPSKNEINHLKILAEGLTNDLLENDVEDIISQSREELFEEMMHHLLQDYTKKAMDIYAHTFERKGVNSSSDLVWFGRVETHRYWKASVSEQVRHNDQITRKIVELKEAKQFKQAYDLTSSYILEKDIIPGGSHLPMRDMTPKSGDNYHIHVVVSRKDKTQKIKLSPLAKHKGNSNHIINGNNCQIGFFRNGYTQQLEQAFDQNFSYERTVEETFQYLKAKKLERNGVAISPDIEIVEKIKKLYSAENNILILSSDERAYLYEVAELKRKYDSKMYPGTIDREVDKMIKSYEYHGIIAVPDIGKDIDSEHIKILESTVLEKTDHKHIGDIARLKVTTRLGISDNKEFFSALAREKFSIEDRYYLTGQIIVPAGIDTAQLDAKYIITDLPPVTQKDYSLISEFLEKKIEVRWPDLEEDKKISKLKVEFSKLENKYYRTGNLITPFGEGSLVDQAIASGTLEPFNDEVFRGAAEKEVEFRFPEAISENQREVEIEKIINKYTLDFKENQTNTMRELAASSADGSLIVQNAVGSFLEESDYDLFRGAAEREVEFRFPTIPEKQREVEIEKIINRYETNHYHNGIMTISKDIYTDDDKYIFTVSDQHLIPEDVSKEIGVIAQNKVTLRLGEGIENKRIVETEEYFLSLEYMEIDKLPIPQEVFSIKDFQQIKKVAELKVRGIHTEELTNKEFEGKVYKEILKMENEFKYNGKIYCPNEMDFLGSDEIFIQSLAPALDAQQYNEICSVVTQIETLKLEGLKQEMLLNPKIIDRKVNRLISEYYKSGEIRIPKNIEASTLFNPNLSQTLSKEEFGLLEKSAGEIILNRYPSIDSEERKTLVSKKLNELERQYYYYDNGVTIPKSDIAIENPKISFSEKTVLSNTDYAILYKAADYNINNGSPIDREEYVSICEGRFYSDKNVILHKGDYDHISYYSSNNTKFSQSIIEPLRKEDYSILSVIAEKEVAIRFAKDITDEKKAVEIKKIIIRNEDQYLESGEIKVPGIIWNKEYSENPMFQHSEELIIPYEKSIEIKEMAEANLSLRMGEDFPRELLYRDEFILSQKYIHGQELDSSISSLVQEDFKTIKSIAEHKISMLYPDGSITIKERNIKVYKEILTQEKAFQYSGKIFVPSDLSLPIDNEKFISSTVATLTAEQYSEIVTVATSIENAHLLGVESYKIDLRASKMTNEYYSSGEIRIPENIQASILFKSNLSQVLTNNEYALFHTSAREIILNRYPSIDSEERKTLVSKKLNELERQYYFYDKGVLLPNKDVKVDNSKISFSKKTVLSSADYAILYAAADVYIENGSPIDREDFVSWYEGKHNLGKNIVLPKGTFEENTLFSQSTINPLKQADYAILNVIAHKEVAIKFSSDITDERREAEINKIIYRCQEQYMESGEIKVADVVWDKKYFENLIFKHSDELIIPYEKAIEINEMAVANLTLRMGEDFPRELLHRDEFILSQQYIQGKEQDVPSLGKEDYKAIKEIAEHKMNVLYPYENLTPSERSVGVYEEIMKMEKDFQYSGKIIVPTDLSLPIDNEKFISSTVATVTPEQYTEMVKVASIIEKAHSPNVSLVENKDLQYRVNRMVSEYYSNGKINIPLNIKASQMFSSNLSQTLSPREYELLEITANKIIENKCPGISEEQKKQLVSQKISGFENQYYYNEKGLSLPDIGGRTINKKISIDFGKFLSKADYANFQKAAEINIKNGSHISKEEYVSMYEKIYYSDSRVVLPRGDYSDARFNQSVLSTLDSKDYNLIQGTAHKMAEGKEFINERAKGKYISNKISEMEKSYWNNGEIQIPNASEASRKFKNMNIQFLNKEDYKYFELSAVDYLTKSKIPITEQEIRNQVNKYEYQYYTHGSVNVNIYQGQNKNIKEHSKSLQIHKKLINAALNYAAKDLPETRELLSTSKKGIAVYKSVRSVQRAQSAARLGASVAKSITMSAISKAIPYVGVVTSAVSLLTAGKSPDRAR